VYLSAPITVWIGKAHDLSRGRAIMYEVVGLNVNEEEPGGVQRTDFRGGSS
jgi:hypothetical protein